MIVYLKNLIQKSNTNLTQITGKLYKFSLLLRPILLFFSLSADQSLEFLTLNTEKSFSFPPDRVDYIHEIYECMPPIIKYAYKGLAVLMAKELKNVYSPNYVYANKFPEMGYCPLAGAIYAHSYKGVKLLLEAGADPNILFTGPLIFSDTNYNTLNTHPLAYAICRNADLKIIKLLIDYGADINAAHNPFADNYLLTPLMLANMMGNKKVIALLNVEFLEIQ